MPDDAGGFSFKVEGITDNQTCYHRNRFITWRISHDLLELSETSLDYPLIGSQVRYRFQDSPILTNGVSVHETFNAVVVLVCTVGSVHKLMFSHPRRISKINRHLLKNPEDGIPSVFADATPNHAKEYCHVIHSTGTGIQTV